MECVNCSSFKTGGCGRMERFQKSCRCVMADCCTCLFSQPCLLGTLGEFSLVAKKIYSAITQKASSAWLSGSGALWSVVTILSDQKISLCISFQEFKWIPCLAKNRFPCWQKLSKSLIYLYRKQPWQDLLAIHNPPLARYLEMHCITQTRAQRDWVLENNTGDGRAGVNETSDRDWNTSRRFSCCSPAAITRGGAAQANRLGCILQAGSLPPLWLLSSVSPIPAGRIAWASRLARSLNP